MSNPASSQTGRMLAQFRMIEAATGGKIEFDHMSGQGYRWGWAHSGRPGSIARYISPRLNRAAMIVWCDAFLTGWNEAKGQVK